MSVRAEIPPGDPFDPASFRRQGHEIVDLLADYLARVATAPPTPVLPPAGSAQVSQAWPAGFKGSGPSELMALLSRVIDGSNHLHHPRYIGHQVTSPLPVAALCELVAALLNNGMAVYEMGPVVTIMERRVLEWMAGLLGWGDQAAGVLTSGGSSGNLTALLAMRQAKAGFDIWNEGQAQQPPLAVLASDQTHYCVRRSAQIMGWGANGVVVVPTDARYRLRPAALADALRRAHSQGLRVIGVAASAGSTATGAFDRLDAVADFCDENDLWLHVDGAHGASIALCPEHRDALRGIERADSVVWDAHKMLLMPALITAVLFRDGRHSREAFAQNASYLFAEGTAEDRWFDVGLRTLECTKRMMSLKLYVALSLYGEEYFSSYVAGRIALARQFAQRLRDSGDFQVAVEPECNIVCFRYAPAGAVDLDMLQRRIRERLLADGSFYIVQTQLRDGLYLRTTIINPATTIKDLDELITATRAAAKAD